MKNTQGCASREYFLKLLDVLIPYPLVESATTDADLMAVVDPVFRKTMEVLDETRDLFLDAIDRLHSGYRFESAYRDFLDHRCIFSGSVEDTMRLNASYYKTSQAHFYRLMDFYDTVQEAISTFGMIVEAEKFDGDTHYFLINIFDLSDFNSKTEKYLSLHTPDGDPWKSIPGGVYFGEKSIEAIDRAKGRLKGQYDYVTGRSQSKIKPEPVHYIDFTGRNTRTCKGREYLVIRIPPRISEFVYYFIMKPQWPELLMEKHENLVLDLSVCFYINSFFIRDLVVEYKRITGAGGSFVLLGMNGMILELMDMLGLTEAFQYAIDEEALGNDSLLDGTSYRQWVIDNC